MAAPNLPPYITMIREAIMQRRELHNAETSTEAEIMEYLHGTYGDNNIKPLLPFLQIFVRTGLLTQNGAYYGLPPPVPEPNDFQLGYQQGYDQGRLEGYEKGLDAGVPMGEAYNKIRG
uniref:H15 domain-containing protein n=1 Tax=Oryza punctata TaxID=4537 RepID=A0A0E0KMD2_ORYPU